MYFLPRFDIIGISDNVQRRHADSIGLNTGYVDPFLICDEWDALWTDLGGEG